MRIRSFFCFIALSASLLLVPACGGRTNGADAGGLNACVTITPADTTVVVGKTCVFTAQDPTGSDHAWSVAPSTLGTFAADGTFTATSVGTGVILATSRKDCRYAGTARITTRPALVTLSGSLGVAGAGAALAYTDGVERTATADASGRFSFTVPYDWSGTVTPSKAGYTFSPANWTVAHAQADPAPQTFAASPIVLTISGNAGVAGATLAYTDGSPRLATADASGRFSFTVPYGWSGTVTPSRAGYAPNVQGYSFQPTTRSYTQVEVHQTGQDYLATPICHFGVVAFYSGWIGIIDPATQTVTTPFFAGQLGTGGLFDIAIMPDGLTTLVTSFGDKCVNFIDTSNPAAPALAGGVKLSFFAEDVDLTPDGHFALVTNGGFTPKMAVIDVAKRTLVEEFGPVSDPKDPKPPVWTQGNYNAIAIAADGRTVLAADYWGGKVHTLALDAAGHLSYVAAIEMPKQAAQPTQAALRPVNIAISPDGKTAIVAARLVSTAPDGTFLYAEMAFPVLSITGPGQVQLASSARPALNIRAAQSIVFDPSGSKAYVSCVREPSDPRNAILVLDIAAPGLVSHSGALLKTDFIANEQSFGMDALALDPSGRYLYVSNMSNEINAKLQLQVLDVQTGLTVKTLPFDQVPFPEQKDANGKVTAPAALKDALPMGLCFWKR